MRFVIALTLLIALPLTSHGQYDPEHRFEVAQLEEDFGRLRAALEEGHGGLYHYSGETTLDSAFDRVAGRLVTPLTELEFLQLVTPLISMVNDGHTRARLSTDGTRHLDGQPVRLPFKLRLLGRRAYVHRNYSDLPDDRVLGAEVVEVNGEPMEELVTRMLPYLPSDGRNLTGKYRALEGTTTFGFVYALLRGPTTRFMLTLRPIGGTRTHAVTVDGLTVSELTARAQARYPDLAVPQPPIAIAFDDSIATLTIRTFGGGAYRQAGIDYGAFLQTVFDEIARRDIEHLILDVRNNGGGSDEYGKLVYAYLTDRPFAYYRSLELNHAEYAFFEAYGIRQIRPETVRRNARGKYDALGHPNLGPQQPLSPTFRGAVYVLTNGASFSATSELTSIIHHHGRAEFIGEESGGGYYGNTSGRSAGITLPNSGIRVSIPLVRYTMAVQGYTPIDRGVIPDHAVAPSIEDVMAGRDVVMGFTRELIGRRMRGDSGVPRR